jgi:hypothetical protein
MAKLNLVCNNKSFEEYKLVTWDLCVGEGRPPHNAPDRFPCLVRVVPMKYGRDLELIGMFTMVCTRGEAKRIIYPKTNRNRTYAGFTIIEGEDLRASMGIHIARVIERANRHVREAARVDPTFPIQRTLLDEAMSELGGVSGLALVASRVYNNIDGLRMIDFYIVDEADARELVYWNKGPSARLKSPYPELKYYSAADKLAESKRALYAEFEGPIKIHKSHAATAEQPAREQQKSSIIKFDQPIQTYHNAGR